MKPQSLRREFIKGLMLGGGLLGLRSMASGLPPGLLVDPARFFRMAQAQASTDAPYAPQFLILAISDNGQPMNCNVPGMYENPNFLHSLDPAMSATPFALGGTTVTAAKPWSQLPAAMLNRTCFFHYQTGAFQHGTMAAVQTLQGHIRRANMLMSLVADALHPQLGTIQTAPLTMTDGGSEAIVYAGRTQPNQAASDLKSVLGTTPILDALGASQSLRDRDVDAINAYVRKSGNAQQRDLLDSWVNSQRLARAIPENIVTALSAINDNTFASKLKACIALIQAKVAPVLVVNYAMGSDNHRDVNLARETAEHLACLSDLGNFYTQLQAAGLDDNVTYAKLDCFGRSNINTTGVARSGRDHNGLHVCSIAVGKNFRPSVIGGATLQDSNACALGIDPSSGLASASGAISAKQTLSSYGITLATGVGAATENLINMFNDAPTKVSAALV